MSSLSPFAAAGSTPNDADADLDLTIRFSAAVPDVLLTIPLSSSLRANTATLKQLIRARIPPEYATRRLRLIHAGKALVDHVPLSTALKRPVSRPPSRISTPGPYDESTTRRTPDVKGKSALRDPPTTARIYIHCSIGDLTLTADELAAETDAARRAAAPDTTDTDADAVTLPVPPSADTTAAHPGSAHPTPRGFDRLLSAGFTGAEVASLRLQFLSIQAHTHTPDTMPSPNTLRNMEDQWLDNSNSAGGGGGLGGGSGGGGMAMGAEDEATAGALDDMIWGTAMGFFWPIGCLVWGVREEGVWSQRRKMAVVVGVMLNIGLGVIRYTG